MGEQFRIIEYALIIVFILCGLVFLISAANPLSLIMINTSNIIIRYLFIICLTFLGVDSASSKLMFAIFRLFFFFSLNDCVIFMEDIKRKNGFSNQLAILSFDIHFQFKYLHNSNLKFEDLFEKSHNYRSKGDNTNADIFAALARGEKLSIINTLNSVQQKINNRNDLSIQAKAIFPKSKFLKFSKLSEEDKSILTVSSTYINNPV